MRTPPAGPRALLRALECVVRLPLLGDRELGQLLGVSEREALSLRRELERLGWVEWVMPDSAQVRARRRSFLRPEAVPELARLLGRPPAEITARIAARRLEALAGIAAMEAAVGVNALLAGLARDSGVRGVSLADARRLPWDRRAQPPGGGSGPRSPGRRRAARHSWYPHGVAAYGCLRSGGRVAPFLVAWDRAGAPAWWRRELLRRWLRFRLDENAWGLGALPPVVIAAAGEAELAQWSDAARRHESRGERLGLVLATVPELAAAEPGDAIWRTPSRPERTLLARRLDWRPRGSLPSASRPPAWPDRVEALPRREGAGPPPLRSRARLLGHRRLDARSRRERVALISLATDADEKRLVEYLGRNPLLDEEQLSALLELPPEATRRRIERLLGLGVIEPVSRRATGENDPPRRFLLATPGLRWLAARDRVPLAIYARYGTAIALAGSGGMRLTRPSRAYRHFDHAVGVNRALVRFFVDARAAGARLQVWYPEAASERRFVLPDGRGARICPDGAGVLVRGSETCSFLLEYDRGTMRVVHYREKLAGYRDYFALERWRADFPSKPLLLFACGRYGSEPRVMRAAALWSPGQDLLLAPEWGYRSGRSGGILGPIWRRNTGPDLRRTLFEWNAVAGGHATPPPVRGERRAQNVGRGRQPRPRASAPACIVSSWRPPGERLPERDASFAVPRPRDDAGRWRARAAHSRRLSPIGGTAIASSEWTADDEPLPAAEDATRPPSRHPGREVATTGACAGRA